MSKESILNEIKDYLIKARKKRLRIRTIYLKLRGLEKYYYWSDLILLNSIIIGLNDLNLPFSRKEIYSAFKMINKEDYSAETKHSILSDLLEKAKNKSIYSIIQKLTV